VSTKKLDPMDDLTTLPDRKISIPTNPADEHYRKEEEKKKQEKKDK
jgi:hypothetical protein